MQDLPRAIESAAELNLWSRTHGLAWADHVPESQVRLEWHLRTRVQAGNNRTVLRKGS